MVYRLYFDKHHPCKYTCCVWAFHAGLTFGNTLALLSTFLNLTAHQGLTESPPFPEHDFHPTTVFLPLGSKGSYSVLHSLVTCFTCRPTLPKDSLALCGQDSFLINVFVYHPLPQCFDTQDFNKYSVAQKKYGLCHLSLYALLPNTLKMFSLLATRISNEYKDFLFCLCLFRCPMSMQSYDFLMVTCLSLLFFFF